MEHSSGALAAAGVEGEYLFSMALACPEHDYSMDELNPRDFSFNAPYGACPDCLGLGARQEVDPDLVVPDENLTLEEGAIALFSPSSNYYPQMYAAVCEHVGGDMSHAMEGPSQEDARCPTLRPGRREDPHRLRHARRTRHLLVHALGGRAGGHHAQA